MVGTGVVFSVPCAQLWGRGIRKPPNTLGTQSKGYTSPLGAWGGWKPSRGPPSAWWSQNRNGGMAYSGRLKTSGVSCDSRENGGAPKTPPSEWLGSREGRAGDLENPQGQGEGKWGVLKVQ